MPKLSQTRKELLTAMMKDAIYDAAVTVMAEHGVDGMTMDRVAAAASVAKGSLYHYFSGKQDLLRFVHAKTVEPIGVAVEELLARDMPFFEKLEAIVRTVFDYLAKHHGVFELLTSDDSARMMLEPAQRSNRETAIGHFAIVFQQGLDEGVLGPFEARQLAEMFFGTMVAAWERAVATAEYKTPDPFIKPLLQVFLHGAAKRTDL